MRSLLRMLLISVSLIACNSGVDTGRSSETGDSAHTTLPPDSLSERNDEGAAFSPESGDPERETKRQIILNLISSKEEINKLRTEVSDSLAKSGLSSDRRSLFVSTMRQL